MMRTSPLVLLLVGYAGSLPADPAGTPMSRPSPDEYEVVSAVVRYYAHGPVLVVEDFITDVVVPGVAEVQTVRPDFGPDIVEDFAERTRLPAVLEAKLDSDLGYRLIPQQELEAVIAESIDVWKAIRERHGRGSRLQVSRPGFNAARDKAIIFAEFMCGEECGIGEYLLLVNDGLRWEVRQGWRTWVS